MKLNSFLLLFLLSIGVNANCQWSQKGQTIFGDVGYEFFASSISLSSDANILAIGAYEDAVYNPLVKVYFWDGSLWNQMGSTLTDSIDTGFGLSVSLSDDGNILAIGAPHDNNYTGLTRIYEWNGSDWSQLGSNIINGGQYAQTGFSVSLSSDGTSLAVGSPGAGTISDIGEVQIYIWDGNNWIQKGQTIVGEALHDKSGESVSLSADGNTIAIGAENNDGNGVNSGHVRVYTWDGISWIQKGIDIDGHATWDKSGTSVSISDNGDIVAIGSRQNSNTNGTDAGCARMYSWDGTNWNQIGLDLIGIYAYDEFGESVSLSSDGTAVVIGTRMAGPGYVHVYKWDGSTWVLQFAQDSGSGLELLGRSTSISSDGKTIAAGATNGGVTNQLGYAKVFKQETAGFDRKKINRITIFPNPAKNQIQTSSQFRNIKIVSIDGKTLITSHSKTVDISLLSSGSYIIEITDIQGVSHREILVVE